MKHPTVWKALALLLVSVRSSLAAEVTIAPDRMLVVDGRRIFVIGLYENPKEDMVLDEVARAGFNLVRASGDRAVLDRLHARNLYAWITTGGCIKLQDTSEEAEKPLREMAAAWGSHPALLVWEVPDEALWSCMRDAFKTPGTLLEKIALFEKNAPPLSERMTAGYTLLKQLDPHHPVWMNHAAGNSHAHLAMFARGADIVGCDIYPVMPYPTRFIDISRSALASVGVCTTRMQSTAPGKPVWMVLQGAGWGDFEGIFTLQPRPGQQPSLEESRFMAYDAIVRGARGVLYWGTHYIAKDSQCWKTLRALARDLADRQPLLTAPDAALTPGIDTRLFGFLAFRVADAPIGVRVLGKEIDGQTWWIVVNEFFFPVQYTLQNLEALEGVTYRTASGSTTVAAGALSGGLPRYGVDILQPAH